LQHPVTTDTTIEIMLDGKKYQVNAKLIS